MWRIAKVMLTNDCYLIVSATYAKYGTKKPIGLKLPRVASTKSGKTPSLKPGEVAIKLHINLPEALFEKPTLHAKITVDKGSVVSRSVDLEVVNNITELMQEQYGIRLEIENVSSEQ
jgi:hypothetical protein